jgi:type VI secretion system protein VasL
MGSDPRSLSDYSLLRDELAKLSHPARPDVNWQYAEKLCLALFEHNGVELQTTAWYTLVRTQLAGISGLNEGLMLLEALITHHWEGVWPQPVHVRMEILNTLSLRLQKMMRTLTPDQADLNLLYQAEEHLTNLSNVLQRLELKHQGLTEALRTLLHNAALRLENNDISVANTGTQGIALVSIATSAAADTRPEPGDRVQWVLVAGPESLANIDMVSVPPAPIKTWKYFAAGMFTMLVAGSAVVWGCQELHQPDPLRSQLGASLAPLPLMLTAGQLETLRQQVRLPETMVNDTQQQLTRLAQLSPDWNFDYGRQLLEQAQVLWPDQAKPLALGWQQQLSAAALPVNAMNGWHQGMMKLQQLSDKLDGLDEQKGKYMTVSELKSVVFATQKSFNQAIPVEEQLRVLSLTPDGQPLPTSAKAQLEMQLKQLTARYAQLDQLDH